MKEDFENDEVWDLLGRARPVSVSPYFSRRVLREIRRVPSRPLLPAFLLRWMPAGALAVLTAGFFLSLAPVHSPALADNTEFNRTFDMMAGIDSLANVEEIQFPEDTQDL
ncbi:MAG: hypothetical protein WCQ16_03080 [Verrucomicrobiae bacterium]